MPANLYGGFAIFGTSVQMTHGINPRASQQNTYAGVTGVEHIDLGGRGRTTEVRGILTGTTLGNLVFNRSNLESYHDGVARYFWDSAGYGWRNVLMGPPRYPGGYRRNGTVGFWLPYEVALQHLSQT